ncbi:hypothetical protein IPC1472_29975 [Pseudomonas aeruginosa]|uniref:DUF5447 family protein n=1 Tax=Pseudomonas aeruginosa TaxID=287 RepID=UPI00071B4C27|nr:DUF5447 family protein [Pseudomonas aeruginosa]KSG36228.1 hypothetical protein AO947_15525 [Pseudomonas aeruginosa]MBG7195316.1 DUF5447 family protein [Pseudomonas aeruginosa]MBH8680953.1 DUF5447 family protein [Pseudomonas aeruginosa]MBN0272679.1 DUF5447 family protein [Pseudomonas aeruginosa]MBN0732823.1 DUF5447 family protein [Pseudomonas aeruginosa]
MTASPYYLRQTHTPDCACSVCWSARQVVAPLCSQSPCTDCQPPGLPYLEGGRWLCRPRFFCAKHDPSRRPPKYWHVVYDSGKPTPFVPVREAFQLEG